VVKCDVIFRDRTLRRTPAGRPDHGIGKQGQGLREPAIPSRIRRPQQALPTTQCPLHPAAQRTTEFAMTASTLVRGAPVFCELHFCSLSHALGLNYEIIRLLRCPALLGGTRYPAHAQNDSATRGNKPWTAHPARSHDIPIPRRHHSCASPDRGHLPSEPFPCPHQASKDANEYRAWIYKPRARHTQNGTIHTSALSTTT
jgi:hypothetical protein